MTKETGPVLAVRQLRVAGTRRLVLVQIFAPRKAEDCDWICDYRIRGIDRVLRRAYGVDAIQALTMALEGIRVLLDSSEKQFIWMDGESGETGFSPFLPISFGLKFRKKIEKIVEKEITKHSRRLVQQGKQRIIKRGSLG